jgi:hypothetical protein
MSPIYTDAETNGPTALTIPLITIANSVTYSIVLLIKSTKDILEEAQQEQWQLTPRKHSIC